MRHGRHDRTPVRRSGRAGVCIFLVLLAACDRAEPGSDAGPRVLELTHDTIHLEAGSRLVEVRVRRSDEGDFEPLRVQAAPGDYVRFIATDRGGHAIVFTSHGLEPDARDFLEQSGQLRSPPLITEDASWVITLVGAPTGRYPFHCTTHNAAGVLMVDDR